MQELTPANIQLDESGTPYAPDFADCYFSRQDGLAESRYVFLQGNQLPQRWQGREQFVIAETGFGTGLNFIATWQAWRDDPQRCGRLHYVSIEKHPIPADGLRSLLASWPELGPLAQELLANYPPLLAGFHRLHLAGGRVKLTLCFMDVQAALDELVAQVDAWYLDGFAPARNPAMWQAAVMQGVARLCRADATLATFTAASEVRRSLQAAGFSVARRKGFGKKREMLTALLPSPLAGEEAGMGGSGAPWFNPPTPSGCCNATIIGGGIAGCQTARVLAERGWRVTLLERHPRLAAEASGNRAGVLIPKMTAEPSWGESFYRQAFTHAIRQIRQLEVAGHAVDWAQCGALQLAHEPREAARQQAILGRRLPEDFIQILDAAAASGVAGIPVPYGASYFPQAGWLNPAALCAVLVAHDNIEVRLQAEGGDVETGGVRIIAGGREANRFPATAFLPFRPVMGQTSHAGASDYSRRLKTTLGHDGYLTPTIAGGHVFGATFVRDVHEPVMDAAADETNFHQLERYLPDFAASLGTVTSGHAAVRMTTPDRYPVVGAVPDEHFYQQAYADLRYGRQWQVFPPARYQEGVFMAAGFGSRGLVSSGLCAELLADLLTGAPLPVQRTLYQNLHPARFLIRQLRKGRG